MRAGPENALDHVVVVMFENRSFDNLLGRLFHLELAANPGALARDHRPPGSGDARVCRASGCAAWLLGKSILLGVLALAQDLGKTVPEIKPEDTITGAQAVAIGHEILGELFPAISTTT
jgi:hypothetical protein